MGLKLNMEFVKRIEFRQSKRSFHCVNGNYVNLCQDQMNSSYVNGSRAIFVFEKIPASLNNTKLYCVAKFTCIHENTYHDPIEKIIILQYKGMSILRPTLFMSRYVVFMLCLCVCVCLCVFVCVSVCVKLFNVAAQG